MASGNRLGDRLMSESDQLGRGGMSALSPFYPQLRTLLRAVGTAEKCQKQSLQGGDQPRSPRQLLSWLRLPTLCAHVSAIRFV